MDLSSWSWRPRPSFPSPIRHYAPRATFTLRPGIVSEKRSDSGSQSLRPLSLAAAAAASAAASAASAAASAAAAAFFTARAITTTTTALTIKTIVALSAQPVPVSPAAAAAAATTTTTSPAAAFAPTTATTTATTRACNADATVEYHSTQRDTENKLNSFCARHPGWTSKDAYRLWENSPWKTNLDLFTSNSSRLQAPIVVEHYRHGQHGQGPQDLLVSHEFKWNSATENTSIRASASTIAELQSLRDSEILSSQLKSVGSSDILQALCKIEPDSIKLPTTPVNVRHCFATELASHMKRYGYGLVSRFKADNKFAFSEEDSFLDDSVGSVQHDDRQAMFCSDFGKKVTIKSFCCKTGEAIDRLLKCRKHTWPRQTQIASSSRNKVMPGIQVRKR